MNDRKYNIALKYCINLMYSIVLAVLQEYYSKPQNWEQDMN